MATGDSSFDVVSKVDMPEVVNAVDQAKREIETRFDFKGSISEIELDEKKGTLILTSDNEARLTALVDVLESKLHKRGIDIRQLDLGDVEPASKGTVRQTATVKQGMDTETVKKVVKAIKDSGIKVQAAIQADTVRVSGKKLDDLQAVIALLKTQDYGTPLQFTNRR
ncbi:MAG: YajQ family cyclic di-GMP-binding protein [Armatimonadetes bacterium]|nr:YajQ family cyclic di-GMP-binding protein [Armatimonadota bacterium]